jgi:hypothetical protein
MNNFNQTSKKLTLSVLISTFVLAFAKSAQAAPINLVQFGQCVKIESFEGLSPKRNTPLVDNELGYLRPGANRPLRFKSGVTLTNPIPNNFGGAAGVLIGDWSIGRVDFALGENGRIASVAVVPEGSAYIALNSNPGPIEFTFASDMLRVGALVTGGSEGGSIVMSAYDASGNLLETTTISTVTVSNWGSNFVGLENSTGIRKVTFANSNPGIGFNTLVLDKLAFESLSEARETKICKFKNSIGDAETQ